MTSLTGSHSGSKSAKKVSFSIFLFLRRNEKNKHGFESYRGKCFQFDLNNETILVIFTHCGLSIIDNGKKKVKWQVDEDLIFYNKGHISQRLKIAQKVAFNIATFTF